MPAHLWLYHYLPQQRSAALRNVIAPLPHCFKEFKQGNLTLHRKKDHRTSKACTKAGRKQMPNASFCRGKGRRGRELFGPDTLNGTSDGRPLLVRKSVAFEGAVAWNTQLAGARECTIVLRINEDFKLGDLWLDEPSSIPSERKLPSRKKKRSKA